MKMTNINEINTLIKEIVKDEKIAIENKYQKQIAIEKEPFLRELLKGLSHNEKDKMKTYTASDVLNILERLQELYNEDDYLN